MHIEFQYWDHKKGSDRVGSICHITLNEDQLCELAKNEVGDPTSENFEHIDFTVNKVVCD